MPGTGGIKFLDAYWRQTTAQGGSTVTLMLTTTMNAHDLARIAELNIAGLVNKP